MRRIDFQKLTRRGSALVASVMLAVGAGCAAEPEPMAVAPAPTYVEGASVPAPAEPADADVVYVQDPPVVEIETYPSVVYEGVPVYYVGGEWYRRDARGWGHYRQEPQELGRQRESHDRDPRWVQAREVQPRRGSEQVTRPVQVAPPAYVARPEPIARPEQVARPSVAEPRAQERNVAPAVVAPAAKEETQATPPPKRGRAPVRRAPPAVHR